MRVTVIGYGAMGSGMAKRLHLTGHSVNVFDVDKNRINDFKMFKSSNPNGLTDGDEHGAVRETTLLGVTQFSEVIIICVVDEPQCESVLNELLPGLRDVPADVTAAATSEPLKPIVTILVTSTVAPSYVAALPKRVEYLQAIRPSEMACFRIIDAPISGGAVRSEQGSLIVMAAAPCEDIERVSPVLESLTNHIPPGQIHKPGGYFICGPNCGDGMMVKICHQLIAGSNLASAAEGYALAKACGVFSDAFVEICTLGAASSFMLQNRGARIKQALLNENPPCMSSVAVWKKDLGIVRALADKYGLHGRMFEAALGGFEACGDRFGVDKDDSYFSKILQDDANLSASSGVAASVEVGEEPKHKVVLENEFTRVINVKFREGAETLIHTHSVDSLYFFLVPPANPLGDGTRCLVVKNTIYDDASNTVTVENTCMDYGECRFGNHSEKSLTHKIKCISSGNGLGVHCVDIELKKKAPEVIDSDDSAPTEIVTVDDNLVSIVKDKEKARVLKVILPPNSSRTLNSSRAFYLVLFMKGGNLRISSGGAVWGATAVNGDCEWHTPGEGTKTLINEGPDHAIFFIVQWK